MAVTSAACACVWYSIACTCTYVYSAGYNTCSYQRRLQKYAHIFITLWSHLLIITAASLATHTLLTYTYSLLDMGN